MNILTAGGHGRLAMKQAWARSATAGRDRFHDSE
jgi:hypothetical protein